MFLSLLFLQLQGKSQSLSDEVRGIVDSLSTERVFEYSQVGIGGRESELWRKFENLQQRANDKELLILLKHENSVVNCYAYLALAKRNSPELYGFLINNLRDNRVVATQSFDVIRSYSINDFYLNLFPKESLTLEKKIELDSILIFDDKIRSSYKNDLIEHLPNDEYYYSAIRQYAISGNGSALVNLAKFKKGGDKGIIIKRAKQKKGAYSGFKAMREFPDEEFLKVLSKQFRKRWHRFHYNYAEFRMLYQALAQYPDEERTLRIFRKTTRALGKWKRETFSASVKLAILKYPHLNFEPILEKIELSDYEEDQLKKLIDRDI
ncbi:MAG: hypothetical protein OCD76_09625 [Reichenbachiella sp.]